RAAASGRGSDPHLQPRTPASDGGCGVMAHASAPVLDGRRAILPPSGGMRGALSDAFWRKPKLLLFLMLLPPVLWLGIVYIGSLIALLAQSFFSIDEFSGLINHELTLKTYRDLLQPSNL